MHYKKNLLVIFFIVLLTNGCEKKNEIPVQAQADGYISGEFEIYDNNDTEKKDVEALQHIESMEKPVVDTSLINSTQTVELILKSIPDDHVLNVDQNVTILYFFKDGTISIEGLGKLPFLETLVFEKMAFITDYSFLSEVPNLKRLFITGSAYAINDMSFIEQLPNLEVFHIVNYYQSAIKLDLRHNNNLEYIGFRDGSLEMFPDLLNIPDTLKYLNFQGNKILSLPLDYDKYEHLKIFFRNNPYERNGNSPDNLIFDADFTILEEKYRLPEFNPINIR